MSSMTQRHTGCMYYRLKNTNRSQSSVVQSHCRQVWLVKFWETKMIRILNLTKRSSTIRNKQHFWTQNCRDLGSDICQCVYVCMLSHAVRVGRRCSCTVPCDCGDEDNHEVTDVVDNCTRLYYLCMDWMFITLTNSAPEGSQLAWFARDRSWWAWKGKNWSMLGLIIDLLFFILIFTFSYFVVIWLFTFSSPCLSLWLHRTYTNDVKKTFHSN
jgi:hypothetical protein